LQQVVFDAFDGLAYVVDNKNQTLTIYVSPEVSAEEAALILQLDILPRPITFSYNIIIQAAFGVTFGFANNPMALGFSSISDPSRTGGIFARVL
jgi:phage terminase large subunit